jgi:hypothetical protein
MNEIVSEPLFRPIVDKAHFPVLTAGRELPCSQLVGCRDLMFYAPENRVAMVPIISKEGTDWHLYGDTCWPSPNAWVEFDTAPIGFHGGSGVLVLNDEIPEEEPDPIGWLAANCPLMQIFPEERSKMAINQRLQMFRQQAASLEVEPGPDDFTPAHAQSYVIYRNEGGVRLVASYSDVLNAEGVPIPKYRVANVNTHDVSFCRFSLHALFSLNRARLEGTKFLQILQLEEFAPVYLEKDKKNPKWACFHPSRMLKTRSAVRALPSPTNMIDGIMFQADFERLLETRRLEEGLELLAFSIDARHAAERIPHQEDADACIAAYTHRANGGAIYVLPDRLVEEFDNTDCDEVRITDLKLPFTHVYITFTPPKPLYLAEGAPVDGCYIVKQQDDYFISLTSRQEGVDYVRSIPLTSLDPRFNLHLPAKDSEMTVIQAVEAGIKAFMAENAPPTEDMSQTMTRPDGTTFFVEDIRAKSRKRRIAVFESQETIFRACLNIIINAACFISFRPEDITEEWDGEVPAWVPQALADSRDTRRSRDRRRDAEQHMSSNDYCRIRICGKNLFPDLSHLETGTGVSPRAHWRRGHWRRQRYGTALALVKPIWIRPTIVKKDNGPLVDTRIYGVEDRRAV